MPSKAEPPRPRRPARRRLRVARIGVALAAVLPVPAVHTAPPTSAGPGPSTTAAALPAYRSTIARLDAGWRERVTGSSWRPGCPVGLDDLRVVTVRHVDFAGAAVDGVLVVHRTVAASVARVFGRLYAARFPVRRIQPVDDFGADDDASTAADNTSGFNCRRVEGTTRWSNHAGGRAVDVNPVENPFVRADGSVLDPAAAPFVDRRTVRPGMAVPGGVLVRAFAAEGWGWGGRFRTTPDYQHFSVDGR